MKTHHSNTIPSLNSSHRLKLVMDENIAEAEPFFGLFGDISFCSGRSVSQEDLINANVLLVRSVTKVNAALLEGTSVQFVGSATIGTDHIDLEWLRTKGISFAHAPGCNAQAVTEYVLAVLARLHQSQKWAWGSGDIGIMGGGHVGGRLARVLTSLGLRVKVYDPFLHQSNDLMPLVSLDEVLNCEVLSLHTPLTHAGPHPTVGLVNDDFLRRFKGSIVINSARGKIIDEAAMIRWLKVDGRHTAVLDVWPSEPHISNFLMQHIFIGTPHIAGYSLEGKIEGTRQLYRWLCKCLGVEPNDPPLTHRPSPPRLTLNDMVGWDSTRIVDSIVECYNVKHDDLKLRDLVFNSLDLATGFDTLRKTYPVRREFLECLPTLK